MRATIRRLALAGLILVGTAATAQTQLPSLGDPADQILSPRQEAARALYESFGYAETHREESPAGEMVFYGKELYLKR